MGNYVVYFANQKSKKCRDDINIRLNTTIFNSPISFASVELFYLN